VGRVHARARRAAGGVARERRRQDVHGEVFRVGLGNVWMMRDGTPAPRFEEGLDVGAAELGGKLKEELAKA